MVGWFGLVWFVNSYLLFQNMHLEINTWAIFGPLHFNEHPARAGQKMEHLTNHSYFPSTLCASDLLFTYFRAKFLIFELYFSFIHCLKRA